MYSAKKEEEAERMDGRMEEEEAGRLLTNVKGRVVRFHTAATAASNRVKPLFLFSFFLSCCSAGRGEEEEMENVDVSLNFCVSDAPCVCPGNINIIIRERE